MKRISSRRAKALEIPQSVKRRVWERDGAQCILCGNREAMPNAHYISRAQGGLGVEQNVVTLCADCHRRYDQSTEREMLRKLIKRYLQIQYEDWNEEHLRYRKGSFMAGGAEADAEDDRCDVSGQGAG